MRPAGFGRPGRRVAVPASPVGAVIGFAACGGGLSCTVPQFLSAAGHADPDHPGGGIARVAGLGYLGLVGGPALIGGCASVAGLPAALCIPVVLGLCVASSGPSWPQVAGPRPLRAGRSRSRPGRGQRNGSCPTGRITISLTSTAAGWPTAYITAAATSAGASFGSSCRPGPAGPGVGQPGLDQGDPDPGAHALGADARGQRAHRPLGGRVQAPGPGHAAGHRPGEQQVPTGPGQAQASCPPRGRWTRGFPYGWTHG